MKKSYFIAAMLLCAFAVNLEAQFVELDGKTPAFWVKFDETVGTYLKVEGSQFNNWEKFDGTWSTDTVYGHPWGGAGTFEDFTMQEQTVNSDNFEELFLPTIHWDSYASLPGRPQGLAAYASEGYGGPRADSARTICFYINVTDSARADTGAAGAWDKPYFYGMGNWQVDGERLYWYLDPAAMSFSLWFGASGTSTAENLIPKNEWAHIALTVPKGGAIADMRLWVNGAAIPLEYTGDLTKINTTLEAAWDGIRIGALVNLWMADFRVYDVELTEGDFVELLGLNVATRDLQQQDLFKIYPVPNNGVFTLELTDSGIGKMVVTNTLGQIVYDQFIDQKETINLSHLPSGMYFISLRDNNRNLQTSKILIK